MLRLLHAYPYTYKHVRMLPALWHAAALATARNSKGDGRLHALASCPGVRCWELAVHALNCVFIDMVTNLSPPYSRSARLYVCRYGDNPNRVQRHTQFQVILKPDPGNAQVGNRLLVYVSHRQVTPVDERRAVTSEVADGGGSHAILTSTE